MSITAPTRASTTVLPVRLPAGPSSWPATVWALLLGTFVSRAAGFGYPFLAYRLADIRFSSMAVGLVLGGFGVGWLVGQIVCGWLADRAGHRTTLLVALLLAAGELPLLAAARSLPVMLVVSLVAGALYDAPRPVVTAALVQLLPDDRQRTAVTGWRLLAVNLGAAIAGAAGGLLADRTGYAVLCWANAASCAVFAAIAVPFLGRRRHSPAGGAARLPYRVVVGDRRLWVLCAASLCTLTCAVALMSALPMMMSADGLPASAYGVTQVANAGAVVALTWLVTPLVSRRAGSAGSLLKVQAASSVGLGVGLGAAGLVHTTLGYSLAVVVAVPGEIAWFIAATEVVTLLAPPGAVGGYHGLWGMTFAAAVTASPLLAGGAMSLGGNCAAGAAIAACGLAGAALCVPLNTTISRQPLSSLPRS